ncbi:MAG: Ig-like domain-containing protein [Candidatus Peribacteria bacterium]|jgi:hypothetical protein|nr:Ig-like domain-containing protein [Candidatus Peribacteria bacterium]
MKTKRKFFIALVAMMFLANASSWVQSNYAGERTVTSPGNVDLTSWIVPVGQARKVYLLKIVAEYVDPSQVYTGVNAWSSPYRSFPIGYPPGYENAQWAPCLLPGSYPFDAGAKGIVGCNVSYITDPWVGVDQEATTAGPHLKSFNGTITAQHVVNFKLSSTFANENYTKALSKVENGTFIPIGRGVLEYQILASSGSGQYRLRTDAGSSTPIEDYYFNVIFIASTVPVTGISLNQTSLTATLGDSPVTLTATVQPDNATDNTVVWMSSNSNVATVSNGVINFVGVGDAVITAKTQDGNLQTTCNVNVQAPPLTQYTIVVTANPTTGGAVIGGGTFNEGTSQTVVATPANGWKFVNWAENGNPVSTEVSFSFTLNGNRSLVANFEEIPPATYQVSFSVNLPDAIVTLGERTQGAGQYLFDGVLPGTYAYTVSKEGYQTVSGNLEVVNQAVVLEIILLENPPDNKIPIFRDLKGAYRIGDAPVPLTVMGEGMEALTFTITVNGNPASVFTPNTRGSFRIEAVSSNGLKIWKIIEVN